MGVNSVGSMAASFSETAAVIQPALDTAMGSAMAGLAAYIQDSELSGQVLNARTGRLRNSIQAALAGDDGSVSGTVSADTPYAAIQEYGGVIELTPRHQPARRLRKPDAGQVVEPQRSYLRQVLMDKADQIAAALTVAMMETIA